jgi:MSHA biogenesis protein MshG
MPLFVYQGRDHLGNLKKDERTSPTADALGAQLINEGITPISIKLKSKSRDWNKIQIGTLFEEKVSTDDLGMLSRQIYTLAKTGVPLPNALRQLSKGTKNHLLAEALNGIVDYLEGGQDIASAMLNYPKVFTPLMISMVRVGQSSGRLAEAFLQISEYLEFEGSSVKNIKTALRYPTLVVIAMIAAIILINVLVIPAFARVFLQAKIELPLPTRILIVTSHFFTQYWIYILVFIVSFTAYVLWYVKTEKGRYNWDRLMLHLPLFGKLLKRIFLLRFVQTFATILDSGVPLIEGIELSAQAVNNEFIRRKILSMRESIERGNSLTLAAASTDLFTPMEIQILGVSEETGELSSMLRQIADFYRREVDYDMRKISDTIEPALIVLLSGVILILALAVYLPIWNMAQVAKIG